MAKLFQGKEDRAEEMNEAKALKSGKISMRDYVQGEEGEGHSRKEAMANGKALKSGKMSPQKYASKERGEKKMMADGGYVCGGHRSPQDYGK